MGKYLLTYLGIVLLNLTLNAQMKRFSGWVQTEEGMPLAGVSVVGKGTSAGTVTDESGYYELEIPGEIRFIIDRKSVVRERV